MDNLKSFLRENAIQMEAVDYAASKRFIGEDGKPVNWRLKPLTSAQNDEIVHRCQKKELVPGTRETRLVTNMEAYSVKVVCACVTYPDLNSAELQESYSAIGAEDLICKMLSPGEFADLFLAVQQINGFQTGMDEKVKQAKN